MIAETAYEIRVCEDCMSTQANGECGENPDREPWGLLKDNQTVTSGMAWEEHSCSKKTDHDSDEECECERDEFSWSGCQGCGSVFGGSRYAMTIWEKNPRPRLWRRLLRRR